MQRITTPFLLFMLAGLALPALGHDETCEHAKRGAFIPSVRGFDEATGRDLRVYPPDRVVDLTHMRLEILIPDMNTPRLGATQTYTLAPIDKPVAEFQLDAKAMTITSVSIAGREASFEHDGEHLLVRISPPLEPGVPATMVTTYELDDPPVGLIWTPESPAWPGRAAQIHTQGQPQDNAYWFPARDFPNERLTTEIIVTVPAGYLVSSNGTLASRERRIIPLEELADFGIRALQPYDVYHWTQDKPHVSYLVSLVVGKFDVVDVSAGGVPMPVYVPPGRGTDVPGTYARTPAMADLFARLFDEPYPWGRYAQVVVWNFGPGGMENTSATTMYDTAILAPDAVHDNDLDGLISHELGHQWFGDLITCNSWEHIWLNEGFATYCTSLWFEHRDGSEAYDAAILGAFDRVIESDRNAAPNDVGMGSKVYAHPWEVFRRAANPYPKGSSVLHMLRRRLGDENFFKGIANYIDARKLDTAETSDLRTALESVSGQSLEQFFSQWVFRPGIPRLSITLAWDEASRSLKASINQTQTIDGDNPAFEFDLPIFVQLASGDAGVTHVVPVRGRTAELSLPMDSEPLVVAVDPSMSLLAEMSIDQPASRWATQLVHAPTFAARLQAARALGKSSDTRHAEMLRRIAVNASEPVSLRVEAVKALTARGSEVDVRSLVTTARDRWEVRQAVSEGIAALANRAEFKDRAAMRASIAEVLSERAQRDESVRVRAASLRGLGTLGAVEYVPVVLAALDLPSQHDQIRQAALQALADLAPPEGLSQSLRLALPGTDSRTRAIAIEAASRMASQDPEAAFNAMAQLLNDREARTRRAAGQALSTLGDARCVGVLEAHLSTRRTSELKEEVSRWIAQAQATQPKPR